MRQFFEEIRIKMNTYVYKPTCDNFSFISLGYLREIVKMWSRYVDPGLDPFFLNYSMSDINYQNIVSITNFSSSKILNYRYVIL